MFLLTIIGGLLSRTAFVPELIYPYLGDALYAVMIYLLLGLLFPGWPPVKVVFVSISICYLIEVSQLLRVPWMEYLRSYKLGVLILGYGFLWSDLISYAAGGVLAFILEIMFYRNKRLRNK